MSKARVFRKNLLWLAPIALIVFGVLFVVASLQQDRAKVDLGKAPLRLQERADAYAQTWGERQAASAGDTTTNIAVAIVKHVPNGTDAYTMSGLVTQRVSRGTLSSSATPPAENTVITCVEWQVDVITGAVRELHAVVVRLDRGSASTEDRPTLEQSCRNETFK